MRALSCTAACLVALIPLTLKADEGLIRMLVLSEIYQRLIAECEIDIDPGFLAELSDTAALLRSHASEEDERGVAAAIGREALDCDPHSSWMDLLLSAEAGHKARQAR